MEERHVKALGEANMISLMFKYSTPTIIATVASAMYNIVDRIFVGRALGEDALAAVTVCFSPAILLLAVALTISQGTATMLSIRLGEKNLADAEKFLGQSVMLFGLFAISAAAMVLPFIDQFLIFFGATEKILPEARKYFGILIAGQIFEQISYGLNGQIRAEGRPTFAMVTIFIGAILNVFLDWLFLFHFKTGIEGAAYATLISEAVASAWVLWFYLGGKSYVKIRLRNLKFGWAHFKAMAVAGSPSFIMQGLSSFAILIFVRQARFYGSESAIAVIGVSMTATMLMFLPIVGLSMGIQPIIGYNWGAGNYARVKEAFAKAIWAATGVCVASFIVLQVFPQYIFMLFLGSDSAIIEMGANATRILTVATPFIGVNIITSGYFQSTKRPKFSIFITTMRQMIFLVPLFIILPQFFGVNGVWASYPASDFFASLTSMFFAAREFRRLERMSAARPLVS